MNEPVVGLKALTKEPDIYFFSVARNEIWNGPGQVYHWHSEIRFVMHDKVCGTISGKFGETAEEVLRPLDGYVQQLADAYSSEKRNTEDDLDWWCRI